VNSDERKGLRHVGFILGIYLAYLIYRCLKSGDNAVSTKKRLRKMRAHFAKGRRWDVTKGEWMDE
jgi:hypothetical protein